MVGTHLVATTAAAARTDLHPAVAVAAAVAGCQTIHHPDYFAGSQTTPLLAAVVAAVAAGSQRAHRLCSPAEGSQTALHLAAVAAAAVVAAVADFRRARRLVEVAR